MEHFVDFAEPVELASRPHVGRWPVCTGCEASPQFAQAVHLHSAGTPARIGENRQRDEHEEPSHEKWASCESTDECTCSDDES